MSVNWYLYLINDGLENVECLSITAQRPSLFALKAANNVLRS